jgi:hypothetical protein
MQPTVRFMSLTGVCYGGPMQRNDDSPAPPAAPTGKNRTVPLRRARNAELRPREYLTDEEVTRLLEAARQRGLWLP